MSHDVRNRGNCFTGGATIRHGSAWILCALLVIFCANAKLARYEIQRHTLKLATTHAYLDGDETLRKLPKASRLLIWRLGRTLEGNPPEAQTDLLAVAVSESAPFKVFDPEFHLRPPPAR
ncbi:MAG TPA: hypothetical protein VII23_11465 [Terriglobales bacterium]|jgi:hypothetical protein